MERRGNKIRSLRLSDVYVGDVRVSGSSAELFGSSSSREDGV